MNVSMDGRYQSISRGSTRTFPRVGTNVLVIGRTGIERPDRLVDTDSRRDGGGEWYQCPKGPASHL